MTDKLVEELERLLQLAKEDKIDAIMIHAAVKEDRTTPDDVLPQWGGFTSVISGSPYAVHSFMHQLGPAMVPYMQHVVTDIDRKTHGLTERAPRPTSGAYYN